MYSLWSLIKSDKRTGGSKKYPCTGLYSTAGTGTRTPDEKQAGENVASTCASAPRQVLPVLYIGTRSASPHATPVGRRLVAYRFFSYSDASLATFAAMTGYTYVRD
jgi:hypothetical protein